MPFKATPQAPEMMKLDLVLLIEDDDFVADVVQRILSRRASRVLRARDGAEGAQLFAEHESQLDLVMIDCGLPDVDGAALCRVLRRISSTLPLLLTSGWENEAARAMTGEGPTVFLPKPFLPADLEEKVNALVGAIV